MPFRNVQLRHFSVEVYQLYNIYFRMRYSLGDLNPKRDPSPEQKRNDHLGDSGIALSANGDEDGRSAVSRASTANTEVSVWAVRRSQDRPLWPIRIVHL